MSPVASIAARGLSGLVSLGKQYGSASLSEIGLYLKRRPSTLSDMANRAEQDPQVEREKVLQFVRMTQVNLTPELLK